MQNFPEFFVSPWKVRKFELTDLDLVEDASKDEFIPLMTTIPKNYSKEEGEAYIKRQWSRFETGIGYSFALEDIRINKAIGNIYVGAKEEDKERVSIGYWVLKSQRGKGTIQTVLKPVIEWLQKDLGIVRIELYIEPWNEPSLKTARALEFEEEGLLKSWQKIGGIRKDMIMFSKIKD